MKFHVAIGCGFLLLFFSLFSFLFYYGHVPRPFRLQSYILLLSMGNVCARVQDDIIINVVEVEEHVMLYSHMVKAEFFVCTINSTFGCVIAKTLVLTKYHACWLNWTNSTPFRLRGPRNNLLFLPIFKFPADLEHYLNQRTHVPHRWSLWVQK